MTNKAYKAIYKSPIGDLSLLADDQGLLGVWFCGQKYFEQGFDQQDFQLEAHPILQETSAWLDSYFAGEQASPKHLKLNPQGTAFQKSVWNLLLEVPWGQTTSYGQLAEKLSCRSAQAVGSAVGRNPLSLIVPCHRVLGAKGQLTGYAAGLEKKRWLLEHEGLPVDQAISE